MSPETIQRAFDPFFTTKPPGSGTGLGLSTVYGIVKQSGGHINVSSQLGVGSQFRIYLPLLEGQVSPEMKEVPAGAELQGSETILLVEDDPTLLEYTSEVLRQNGYNVIECCGGFEAIEAAERHEGPIHLLLSDMVMPRMNGRVLAGILSERRPEAKILMVSGYSENLTLQGGMLGEGLHFLPKAVFAS